MKSLIFTALALVLASCTSSKQSTKSNSGSIYIMYNNDNFAFLDPCGCRISPIGGIDRRWNAMQGYAEESRVFVDGGNFLFKSPSAADYLKPQWFEQAKGVVEGYNLLHADAVAIGENEFALGVKKFEEIAATANFPFLSANIYKKGTDTLFAKDSILLEKRGKKIGVFAVFLPSLKLPPELEARDINEAAREEVKKLRAKGADLVIALAHEGYENDLKLAKAVPGIDLIVGASSQSLLQNPTSEGDTRIVQLSSQGQMFAYLEYGLQEFPKKLLSNVVLELNADFNHSPNDEANPMKNLIAVTNLRIGQANRKLDEKIWAEHKDAVAGYDTFISCRDCHSKQAEFQEGKPHAASFLALVAKKQETNLDCVKCHSVGLGVPGGFQSMAEALRDESGQGVSVDSVIAKMGKDFPPKEEYRVLYHKDPQHLRSDVQRWIASLQSSGVKKAFLGMQCENCHGGMSGHPFANDNKSPKVTGALCLQCHTKEQAPAWYGSDGKVNSAVVAAAIKEMGCPRNTKE